MSAARRTHKKKTKINLDCDVTRAARFQRAEHRFLFVCSHRTTGMGAGCAPMNCELWFAWIWLLPWNAASRLSSNSVHCATTMNSSNGNPTGIHIVRLSEYNLFTISLLFLFCLSLVRLAFAHVFFLTLTVCVGRGMWIYYIILSGSFHMLKSNRNHLFRKYHTNP